MAGLDTPSSGEITIKGTSLSQLNELELSEFRAKNIGIIFQQFHLLEHLSALENVSLPLEIQGTGDHKEYRERAAQMLAQVGLDHRLNHFPTQLSGGEKQRVAIARAAIIKPSILLADEPSGNLDTQTGKQIMDLLFNLSNEHNVTLILVTHDLELARRCEREIHIRGGVIQ
jgi:putative ABC transport system ATP-binding protein